MTAPIVLGIGVSLPLGARLPRLLRDGKLHEALALAGDALDVHAGALDVHGTSPKRAPLTQDDLIALRDLLDAATLALAEQARKLKAKS